MQKNLRRLWFEAKGYSFPDWMSGRPPKACYLCGKEEDWLLGLRKLVPIYGKVKECSFASGISAWIWESAETYFADFADGEGDCVREICAKPGCWFDNGATVTDVRTGEEVVILPCPSRRIVRLLRDFVIDSQIYGYAAMRYIWFVLTWLFSRA